jgi:hypothetical protein
MPRFISIILAISLLFSVPAIADPGLAPGKPAGIVPARSEGREAYLLGAISGLGLIGGIILIFFHKKSSTSVSSTGTR